jgi:hypothetical protein
MKTAVVFKPGVVKATVVEISPVVSFEKRAIMFKVETIPVVPVPGRVIVISVSGEVGFTGSRSGIVASFIYRGGSGYICASIYYAGGRNISPVYRDPYNGMSETYAGADIDL